METAVSTSAAVLQALTGGPRYGRDLIRQLKVQGAGTVKPRPGTVYRAAEALVARRLLRTWIVVPGGRRGARARRYYELTARGIAAAEAQRAAVERLFRLSSSRGFPRTEARAMALRLEQVSEASVFVHALQSSVSRTSARRP